MEGRVNREPMRPPDVEIGGEEPMTAARWKIDRHVPLALIGAIMLQTAIAIWWAASFSATTTGRLDASDSRVTALERTADRTTLGLVPMSERLVRLEVQLGTIKETTDKIEALIRRAP